MTDADETKRIKAMNLRYKKPVAKDDCIKSAMDILRSENTGLLQLIKQIEELYEKANEESKGFKYDYLAGKTLQNFNRLLENMPQEAWIQ